MNIVELYRALRCWLLVSGVTAGRQIYGPVLGSLTTSSWVVTSVLVLAPSSSWSTSPRHRYLPRIIIHAIAMLYCAILHTGTGHYEPPSQARDTSKDKGATKPVIAERILYEP